MDLTQEKVGETVVLQIKGRIDSSTAPDLGKCLMAILEVPKSRVLLDLGQLEYISSAGFRILLLAAKRADEKGSRFVLCGLSAKVKQFFDLGGFLDLFMIVLSREEGLATAG
jgi:anti-anti-sigma factor